MDTADIDEPELYISFLPHAHWGACAHFNPTTVMSSMQNVMPDQDAIELDQFGDEPANVLVLPVAPIDIYNYLFPRHAMPVAKSTPRVYLRPTTTPVAARPSSAVIKREKIPPEERAPMTWNA